MHTCTEYKTDERTDNTLRYDIYITDSSNTNTIILYQLEDKLIAHERLMQFFIDTGVMARLTAVTVDGRRLRTVDYLSEHAEKLVAAMTMKQLPNELVTMILYFGWVGCP